MKTEILNLTYASSLTDLCEINSSFDSGILRIAYTGDNRNGSSISKDVFEDALKRFITARLYAITIERLILLAVMIWNSSVRMTVV